MQTDRQSPLPSTCTLSVIVCTHNPDPLRLGRTLDHLAAQSANSRWELLLIDNASEPPLPADLLNSFALRGRVVREPTLGLSHARARGFAEARGKLIVLVDDDNFIAPNYLSVCRDIGDRHPQLGVWGGQCIPEFECPPETWTREFWSYLALRNLDRDYWCNWCDITKAPCGAGMCLRREVADRYLHNVQTTPERLQLDRRGKLLLSGGDTDLAFTACDIGLGMGLFQHLVLIHYIPKQRLEEPYLIQLVEQIQRSCVWLEVLRRPDFRPPESLALGERLFRSYHRLRLPSRARRFFDAATRGRTQGYVDVSTIASRRHLT